MPKDFTRMLAPPDYTRRVDVDLPHVPDRLADGFRIDEAPDTRGELHASTPNRHKDRAAMILACGPSCSLVPEADIRRLVSAANAITWTTNHAFELLGGRPYNGAEYYMVVDDPFWSTHREKIGRYLMANPFCLPVLAFDPWEDIRHQRIGINMGVEAKDAPYTLNEYCYSKSVGVYAATMALHCGCTTIYLLGHDLTSHEGKSHSHGTRRPEEANGYPQGQGMFDGYDGLARYAKQLGVRVVNLSPISLLGCFEKSTCVTEAAFHESAARKKKKGKNL